jgi:carbonic anhydrase
MNVLTRIPPLEALQLLREGNRRHVKGERNRDTFNGRTRTGGLLEGQSPFALILGCSDSRVPVEIIFDQYLGDLFVIRVAGNIVAPSQVGSVEFAAERFGSRLVAIVGHTQCGAVQAALDELKTPTGNHSPNLRSIVGRIMPAVKDLEEASRRDESGTLLRNAVRANVRASVRNMRNGSPLLESLIREEGLLVVGAEYSLETGEVDFFDGVS